MAEVRNIDIVRILREDYRTRKPSLLHILFPNWYATRQLWRIRNGKGVEL